MRIYPNQEVRIYNPSQIIEQPHSSEKPEDCLEQNSESAPTAPDQTSAHDEQGLSAAHGKELSLFGYYVSIKMDF